MDVSVRGVQEQVFKEFRAKAVARGLNTGDAMNEAMQEWAEKNAAKKPKRSIFGMKPFNGGKDTADVSKNVDKYLYG